MNSNFPILYERLVKRTKSDDKPTLGLRHRVGQAYEAIVQRPYDPEGVAAAVEDLLAYLASPEGRTHPNCVLVDEFFCFRDDWPEVWEGEPEALADILGDMGSALHDTIKAPEIAENFGCTPEQLLERLREVGKRPPAA